MWNWLRETFRLELSGVGMLSEWPHALALGIRQIQRFSKKWNSCKFRNSKIRGNAPPVFQLKTFHGTTLETALNFANLRSIRRRFYTAEWTVKVRNYKGSSWIIQRNLSSHPSVSASVARFKMQSIYDRSPARTWSIEISLPKLSASNSAIVLEHLGWNTVFANVFGTNRSARKLVRTQCMKW